MTHAQDFITLAVFRAHDQAYLSAIVLFMAQLRELVQKNLTKSEFCPYNGQPEH